MLKSPSLFYVNYSTLSTNYVIDKRNKFVNNDSLTKLIVIFYCRHQDKTIARLLYCMSRLNNIEIFKTFFFPATLRISFLFDKFVVCFENSSTPSILLPTDSCCRLFCKIIISILKFRISNEGIDKSWK